MLSDLLMIAAAEFKYEPSKVEHSNPMLTKYEYKKNMGTVHCVMRKIPLHAQGVAAGDLLFHGGLPNIFMYSCPKRSSVILPV